MQLMMSTIFNLPIWISLGLSEKKNRKHEHKNVYTARIKLYPITYSFTHHQFTFAKFPFVTKRVHHDVIAFDGDIS